MRNTPSSSVRRAVLRAAFLLGGFVSAAVSVRAEEGTKPFEAVLTTADAVSEDSVAGWKGEGFTAVVVVLEDEPDAAVLRRVADAVAGGSLDLYYWVEVGRSPALAREHPEWMASLGSHHDWRTRFPGVREPGKGEVAKASPWVPIRYRDAFDAHLKRVERLLSLVQPGYRGVLLNDLQGGPASCGCGNLQCRWATDYGVPGTGTKLDVNQAAARFVAEVGDRAKGKDVIPVWTPECELADLPDEKRPPGLTGTGFCGTVPCFDFCRKMFAEQWAALHQAHGGPTGLLLLHQEFGRAGDVKEHGRPAEWLARAVKYVDEQAAKPLPRARLWLVVQGYDVPAEEQAEVRRAAVAAGAGAVVVARTRVDQSFEPRVVPARSDAAPDGGPHEHRPE